MKLLENNKRKIINQYINGQSVFSLAKTYKVSTWSIKNFLDKNHIKTRTIADLKIKFNEAFFFEETPETYYFWGFMLGDGCLINHKQGHRYITISLKKEDECILQQFCRWLSIDKKHIKYGATYCRLEIYGNFFKDNDFSKYGLIPRKTYNPSKLDIPEKYVKPFILGLIDADGSISFNKKRKAKYVSDNVKKRKKRKQLLNMHIEGHSLQLVGHPLNMHWVIKQLQKIGFDGNINSQLVKGKWKRIRIQKKDDILKLANLLELKEYYHMCLSRKWSSLYKQIIAQ